MGAQDEDRLLRAVERIAMTLSETGFPRMAARVFAYILAEDADHYTAGELAEGLRVSPAAISGAMRYLVNARMVVRDREPGQRSDVYRIHDDDVWGKIMRARLPILEQWETSLADAISEVGAQSRGGKRLLETKEFYAFMRKETEEMLERWEDHRDQLR